MRPGCALAVVLAVGACLASCGPPESPADRFGVAPDLAPAPRGVVRACARARAAVRFPVPCPTRWPPGTGRLEHDLGRPPGAYLLDFANGFARRGTPKAFHLLLGGQRRPFGAFDSAPRISTLERVPMRGDGTFTSSLPPRALGRADVHGAEARILSEPRYPQGGLHGGHVVVAWNRGGHGYLVSLHASGLPRREQVAWALAVARATR